MLRILLVLVILLVGLVVWLNGPGLRWLGPKVAAHFLEKADLTGEFKIDGSLTGGLSISDLKVESAVDSVSVAPVALAATLRLSVAVDASCTACVTQYGPYHSVGATTI